MITIDRSAMNAEKRNLTLRPLLEEFVEQVALVRPLCEFTTTDHDTRTDYSYEDTTNEKGETKSTQVRTETIMRVNVYQDGEKLGALCVTDRYTRGSKEWVYGVESFRITKERGAGDATFTKNLKVALRTVKKVFVNRQDEELRQLIKDNVTQSLGQVWGRARNEITYALDTQAEALGVSMLAYEARKKGLSTYTAPSTLATVKRLKEHDEACEQYIVSTFLLEQMKAKHGYGVSIYSNGSLAVLNFADDSIRRFKSFELLPLDIQNKLAMFKVIGAEEPYAHLGCKFHNDIIYIVADATP
jgi:hypothetical protein